VLIDGDETIEFSHKATLIIDDGAGADTGNLNNPATPTVLTSIRVNADDGDDTVTSNAGGLVAVDFHGGVGNDLLDASGVSAAATLFGEDGNDTLISGSGADNLAGGAGQDLMNPGAGANSVNGGADSDTLLLR